MVAGVAHELNTPLGIANTAADLVQNRFPATGKLLFGSLQLMEDGPALVLGYTLLGEFLNRTELEVAIAAVGATADDYDDVIKARFGGRTFAESG